MGDLGRRIGRQLKRLAPRRRQIERRMDRFFGRRPEYLRGERRREQEREQRGGEVRNGDEMLALPDADADLPRLMPAEDEDEERRFF